MTVLLIIIHVFACIVLIGLVLIQRGRGAGLVESFAGVESMFGTKTSAFLTRTTTIMSIIFFLTCLSLAVLSIKQSKSLIRDTRGLQSNLPPKDSVAASSAAVKSQASVVPEAAPVVSVETAKPDAAKSK